VTSGRVAWCWRGECLPPVRAAVGERMRESSFGETWLGVQRFAVRNKRSGTQHRGRGHTIPEGGFRNGRSCVIPEGVPGLCPLTEGARPYHTGRGAADHTAGGIAFSYWRGVSLTARRREAPGERHRARSVGVTVSLTASDLEAVLGSWTGGMGSRLESGWASSGS